MTTNLFAANFADHAFYKTPEFSGLRYDTGVLEPIRSGFYFDDCPKYFAIEVVAVTLARDIRALQAQVGKWILGLPKLSATVADQNTNTNT